MKALNLSKMNAEAIKGKGGREIRYLDKFPEGMCVLLVDDDSTSRMIHEALLGKCDYHVTTTSQGKTAVEMVKENGKRFDLVVTEVKLPDMDAFRLLEIIGIEARLPVVVLTADSDPRLIQKAIAHGACGYLVKPVGIKDLRNIWHHTLKLSDFGYDEVAPDQTMNVPGLTGENVAGSAHDTKTCGSGDSGKLVGSKRRRDSPRPTHSPGAMLGRLNSPNSASLRNLASSGFIQPNHAQNFNNYNGLNYQFPQNINSMLNGNFNLGDNSSIHGTANAGFIPEAPAEFINAQFNNLLWHQSSQVPSFAGQRHGGPYVNMGTSQPHSFAGQRQGDRGELLLDMSDFDPANYGDGYGGIFNHLGWYNLGNQFITFEPSVPVVAATEDQLSRYDFIFNPFQIGSFVLHEGPPMASATDQGQRNGAESAAGIVHDSVGNMEPLNPYQGLDKPIANDAKGSADISGASKLHSNGDIELDGITDKTSPIFNKETHKFFAGEPKDDDASTLLLNKETEKPRAWVNYELLQFVLWIMLLLLVSLYFIVQII